MAQPATALTLVDRVEQSPAVLMLDARAQALVELLPDEAAAIRFRRVVVQAMVKNPDLLTCTPDSVVLAVFEAAAQGLEPTGAAGGAHLVPYKVNGEKRAQLIPDYRGVIRLVTKPPSEVLSLEARVVKEGDEFRYELGTEAFVDHVPSLAADRSSKATTHVYAVARLKNGSTIPDVEDRAGIERVRNRAQRGDKSPWATDWDEMAKKTIIKRLAKVLPVRPEVRSILVREDELEDQVDTSAATVPAPAGRTKAARLGSRLRAARDVTPPVEGEPAGASEPEPTGLTHEALLAELERLGVDQAYAVEKSKALFPREPNVALTDEQRRALVEALAAEEAPAAAAASL